MTQSSNRVRVTLIEEATYGVTPGAGNFETVRYTSESLSGTPETTESQQIRTDRQSSGQIATGLTVGGDTNHELAKEVVIDKLIESAMYSTFATSAPVAVDLTIDATAKTITRAAGDWTSDPIVVGDLLDLTGFVNSVNNSQVMVLEVQSTTVIRYADFRAPNELVDEAGSGTSYELNDKISIGSTKKSFSMEKAFLDITDKAINYRGMIVGNMSLNAAWGELSTTSFTFQGNDYEPVDAAVDFMTNGRTINAAATTNTFNGSIDMPFIINSSTGTLDKQVFCVQSIEISLNNNLTPQTCIGEEAPQDYSEGTAQIEISMNAYLADENWDFISKKLTQESFSIGFMVKNGGGYYAFFLPAVQVTFDDPASPGQNQDVFLNMSGTAKVGDNGESALTIYKSA